jgi:hypothetical protein
VSNLPIDPYDRTVIVETTVDNPDRAPLAGTGRDIVVSLWPEDKPGRKMAFLSASGEWVPFTTTEFTAWGSILGDITDQADLMAMFALYAPIADLATVAFTGQYNDLLNKPIFGDLAFINTDGSTSRFLRGDGTWQIPVDVFATWGNITGNITAQTDLMTLLNAKAPVNNPTFTGFVNVPTPPVDDNTTLAINSTWFFGQAFNGSPIMDADPASSGNSTLWARGNHRHPSDTSRAPLDSPVFTGIPLAPTPPYPNDSTRIATTEYVTDAIAASGGVSPPPSDGNTYGYKNGAWVILDLATKWDKAS